jgi:hypothetical protein
MRPQALFYAEVCVDDDRGIRLRFAIADVKLNAGTLDRDHRRSASFEAIAVRVENLNSDVVVMKSAQDTK